jgi:hypothetical protein
MKRPTYYLLLTTCYCLLSFALPAHAASDAIVLFNPLGSVTDPRQVIGLLIQGILSVIGSVTLLMFVYGGILWLTAMGDPKKVQKGRDILVWGIMGLMLIAGSYVLVNAIISGITTGAAT